MALFAFGIAAPNVRLFSLFLLIFSCLIFIWMSEAEVATMFNSHGFWVSAVAFHPSRDNVFASVSYDQTVKLWDTRSRTPLSTITGQHDDKILCAEWSDDVTLLTGGADKQLKAHTLK